MCTKVPRQQTWSRVQQKEDQCPGDRKEWKKVGGGKGTGSLGEAEWRGQGTTLPEVSLHA